MQSQTQTNKLDCDLIVSVDVSTKSSKSFDLFVLKAWSLTACVAAHWQGSAEDAVLMPASKESKKMVNRSFLSIRINEDDTCSMKLLCKLSASSFSRSSKALLVYEASWKFRDRESAAGLTCSGVGA
ncbi:hypothetical protein MUK42_15157 [Musa troglodytarum]|uniref:Uncharacterized protein n=1 Tax=Musa troglodytarum TaxID=320322 RepID=A0A9E7IB26_9LILI|nr:hypothetical protein MUK42_15157 [Musa troglodytarum]